MTDEASARPLYERDGFAAHLAASAASAADKAQAAAFAANGFAVLDLADDATKERCDAAVEQLAPLFEGGRFNRVQDAWRVAPAVRRLAVDARVTAFLELVYGRKPFAFQTLNFHRGSRQGAHSDASHFFTDPAGFMCGVWIALEDVHADAGPLLYYPGSHRLPTMTPVSMGVTSERPTPEEYLERLRPTVNQLVEEHGLVQETALIKKGQAFVWASDLLHGGSKVADPSLTRLSQVTHFFFDRCVYYTPMVSSASWRGVRLPEDVATGRWRWSRRKGGVAPPTLAAFGHGIWRRLRRQVHQFET